MKTTLIYVHIPKTAGTTFNTVLKRNFDAKRTFDAYKTPIEQLSRLPLSKREGLRCIKGHIPYGVHQYLSQPCEYITILRDPVDRIMSHYYYVLQKPDHFRHAPIVSGKVSLGDYVSSQRIKELDNGQVRLISGAGFEVSFGATNREMLEQAKDNLAHRFSAIGLTERFDESVRFMCRRFGWREATYAPRNVTKNRPRRGELDPETLAALKQANLLDQELYDFAKPLFERALAAHD